MIFYRYVGYDRIWFLFALEYSNVLKEKRNLIGIEKGTDNRNRKTNKNNEKYAKPEPKNN